MIHELEAQNISVVSDPAVFFGSFTRVDKDHAEWMAYCLEDEGCKVIFQNWDFRPGHNFVLMMQNALVVHFINSVTYPN